jgi:predicted PurR-regulated permease PerM
MEPLQDRTVESEALIRDPTVRAPSSERPRANTLDGAPTANGKAGKSGPIGRAEVTAFALVALLVISVAAVLYFAKAFFLPVVMAFVIGTMLSPAASFLERYRIPRAIGAVLIVAAVGAAAAFLVGLISSPLVEWTTRLPELAARLKDKLHVFDPLLALWRELQSLAGGSDALTGLQLPKFDWVQPTIEFLSPTFTENAATSIEDTLEDVIVQRPLATVGLALGVGFLIGVTWRR